MRDRWSVQRLLDGALVLLLAGVAVAEVWVPFTSVQGAGSRRVATAVALAICAALLLRRSHPLAVALVVLWTWPVVFAVEPLPILFWGQFVPMIVAVFSVARHGSGRHGVHGGVAAAATLLYFDLFVDELQTPGEIVFHWLVFLVAWSAGRGLRIHEARAEDSLRRAIEAEVASVEQAAAAVLEERTRIARELHDVVAHAVSSMVVQAGAAEQLVGEDPSQVRASLAAIRRTGSDALAEMRRMVVVLRDTGEVGGLSPQPGVGALEALVESAARGGPEVSLHVTGEERPLPAGLDLAVYRIVQEALTNARRHAEAARVDVTVRYHADAIEIEVRDDGVGCRTAAVAQGSSGHGLVGMRERANLYGGRLEAGPAGETGFTVRAVLPVGAP